MVLDSELNLSFFLEHATLELLVVRGYAVPLKHEELKLMVRVLRLEEHSSQVGEIKGLRNTAPNAVDHVEFVMHLSIRENVVPAQW